MKTLTTLILIFVFSYAWIGLVAATDHNHLQQPNWLLVSNSEELDRTWSQALVFLPLAIGDNSNIGPIQGARLSEAISRKQDGDTLPTVLYLHSCEGLGHHREDLRRLAKLGFVVIAPNSFARDYRPLGCNEEREKFIANFDLTVAFQKAELDYAVQRLGEYSWIDRKNLFLIGSGVGGMVAAHYQGAEFAGHVIEGWGCRGPNPLFDGIRAPESVRIYSAVSKNDPWYQKNPGFGVDCESFIKTRADGVAVVLDRPAHYVSWYPKSRAALIRFLTRDMDVDSEALAADVPTVVKSSKTEIELREQWSDETVYSAAKTHCFKHGKKSYLLSAPRDGVYSFICE